MKYQLVVCGGTFDLLHKGHKSFLTGILEESDKIVLGLTSDKYTAKFKSQTSEDYKTRKENLETFLKSIDALDRVKITPIDDIYGPLLDKDLRADALAVTPQTNRTAIGINKERKELGLPPVEILVISMDPAEDGDLISSTRIRNGEINREGMLYLNPEWKGKNFKLPENLREELHKPFGKVLDNLPKDINSAQMVTIGDVTTQEFNEKNIGQILSIIDFQVQRQKRFNRLSELGFRGRLKALHVTNPAGNIEWQLFEKIKKAFIGKGRKVILVEGEEDLAVLPVIICAPLGFKIYYGQPDEGLVEIKVTEEIKEKVYQLISKFEQLKNN